MLNDYNSALSCINLPYSRRNILDANLISDIVVKGELHYVILDNHNIQIDIQDLNWIKRRIEQAFIEILHLKAVCVVSSNDSSPQLPSKESNIDGMFTKLSGVSKIITVISGKGGVGKTSISICIAKSLISQGFKVGIADLDIYGPSVHEKLNFTSRHSFARGKIQPNQIDGIYFSSIGCMTQNNTPIIWRGPMLAKAIYQLTREVEWPDLDYLILDTPPGTGDVHLTICQKLWINSVVAVTTRDNISIQNTHKSINMFRKLGHPVDTCIINMSTFQGVPIFGTHDVRIEMKDCDILDFIEAPLFSQGEELKINYTSRI